MGKEVKFVVAIWLVLMTFYMDRTPAQERSHDFWDHVEYTQIIAKEHRLPSPQEGWETYQPPLYYLINSFVAPNTIENNIKIHINLVRILSVIYGVIAFFLISCILDEFITNTVAKILVLMFITTTPSFVFVFSSYNNDSLMITLCLALIFTYIKLEKKWSQKIAFIFYILGTISLYTKITSIVCIGGLFFVCSKKLFTLKAPSQFQLKTIGILLLSIISFLPWMIFHNYKHTGELFARNEGTPKNISIFKKHKKVLGLLLKDEGLLGIKHNYKHEWDKPWVYPENYKHTIPKETKRFDYFGFTFITSVIGEYVLTKPHVVFIWIILFIHLIAYIAGLLNSFSSESTKFSSLIILFSIFCHIILFSPYAEFLSSFIDYRYISWNCALWGILYCTLVTNKNKFISNLSKIFFSIGVIIQSYIMISIKGGYWW